MGGTKLSQTATEQQGETKANNKRTNQTAGQGNGERADRLPVGRGGGRVAPPTSGGPVSWQQHIVNCARADMSEHQAKRHKA
eukprot:2922441-Amphidinium_carterae.1